MLKIDGRPVVVTEPVMRPNHCALNAHVCRDPEGFIDTGTKLPGFSPRVYVAVSSLRDLVRCLGWPTEGERDELVARVDALQAEADQAAARVAELEAQLAAVAVLKQAGFTPARKSGRPAAAKSKAAV